MKDIYDPNRAKAEIEAVDTALREEQPVFARRFAVIRGFLDEAGKSDFSLACDLEVIKSMKETQGELAKDGIVLKDDEIARDLDRHTFGEILLASKEKVLITQHPYYENAGKEDLTWGFQIRYIPKEIIGRPKSIADTLAVYLFSLDSEGKFVCQILSPHLSRDGKIIDHYGWGVFVLPQSLKAARINFSIMSDAIEQSRIRPFNDKLAGGVQMLLR